MLSTFLGVLAVWIATVVTTVVMRGFKIIFSCVLFTAVIICARRVCNSVCLHVDAQCVCHLKMFKRNSQCTTLITTDVILSRVRSSRKGRMQLYPKNKGLCYSRNSDRSDASMHVGGGGGVHIMCMCVCIIYNLCPCNFVLKMSSPSHCYIYFVPY